MTVQPFRPRHHAVVQAVGFRTPTGGRVESFVAVDRACAVQGVAVWGAPTDDASGSTVRVLHLATARRTAPEATVALLIADAAERFRQAGVRHLQLVRRARGRWWPRPLTTTPRHDEATATSFGLRWEPRWLALTSRWHRPVAAAVLRRERRST